MIYNDIEEKAMVDAAYIKLIEELSLNAWPSYQMELYDGWLIRFSYNYTHRTNSVAQVGLGLLPVEEKIRYCEQIYKGHHTPAIFKISPLIDPDFDARLDKMGYRIEHVTENMTMDLSDAVLYEPLSTEYDAFGRNSGLPSFVEYPDNIIVQLQDQVTDEWVQSLFRLNGTANPTLRRIVPKMYAAIPKETIVAGIEIDGRMVACGLGILDREHVGVYAIYVDASCRRKHYARAICSTILSEAKRKGAKRAYLQVVKGNKNAKALYTSLGFRDLYTYWFRAKPYEEL